MSEFQYYEFRALDRSLTQQERAELRKISSRAEITATRFTNEYSWGDLKADPAKLTERYFDAHFYLSNWGSRTLILRFPIEVVPLAALTPYAIEDTLDVWSTSTHSLVQLKCNVEDMDEWWEDKEALADLIPLRQQVMSGDYRCLYMAWLHGVARSEDDYGEPRLDIPAPPLPPGLGALDNVLKRLIDVLWLDPDLIHVAARHSPPLTPTQGVKAQRALKTFIAGLDAKTKDALLLRVASQDPGVGAELMAQFRSAHAVAGKTSTPSVGALLHAAEHARQEREALEAKRARQEAEARALAERARIEARNRALRDRWKAAWQEVSAEIDRRNRDGYRQAAKLIAELKDAATEEPYKLDFIQRFAAIRAARQSLTALKDELKKAGLPNES